MVWECDIAQKINSSFQFNNIYFIRMQLKTKSLFKKSGYFKDQPSQILLIIRNYKKIICVSNIVFNFQILFNKLVKFIHINIGKKLGSQVAYRHTFYEAKKRSVYSLSLSLS